MGESIRHDVRHDLESFYWLLVWIILRHSTKHKHREGSRACSSLFDAATESVAADKKTGWLADPKRLNGDGLPFNFIDALRQMLKSHHMYMLQEGEQQNQTSFVRVPQPQIQKVEITHSEWLRIFDQALAMNGWPEGDAAVPFDPPSVKKQEQADRISQSLQIHAVRNSMSKRKLEGTSDPAVSTRSPSETRAGPSGEGSTQPPSKKRRMAPTPLQPLVGRSVRLSEVFQEALLRPSQL